MPISVDEVMVEMPFGTFKEAVRATIEGPKTVEELLARELLANEMLKYAEKRTKPTLRQKLYVIFSDWRSRFSLAFKALKGVDLREDSE